MMNPRAGDIENFCLKLSQSDLKGLMTILVSISVKLSTGQGKGQVTKGHQNNFSGIIYGYVYAYN